MGGGIPSPDEQGESQDQAPQHSPHHDRHLKPQHEICLHEMIEAFEHQISTRSHRTFAEHDSFHLLFRAPNVRKKRETRVSEDGGVSPPFISGHCLLLCHLHRTITLRARRLGILVWDGHAPTGRQR